MRIRDIVIVAIALLLCIIGWSQEGALNFQRGFKIPISSYTLEKYLMPKPLIVDFKGDGKPVLVATTVTGVLASFNTNDVKRNIENSFIPLKAGKEHVFSESIVGIGAGRLSANSTQKIVAVLTMSYKLYALDEDLKVLWEVSIAKRSEMSNLKIASISVVPERVYTEDEGIVCVAARVLDEYKNIVTLFVAVNGSNGKIRWMHVSDAENAMNDVVREAHNVTAGTEEVEAAALLKGAVATVQRTDRAHNSLEGHKFEQPWTTFREAVIAALPHYYRHPWDTQLRPHTLFRAKGKKKLNVKSGHGTYNYGNSVIHMNKEDYSVLGEKLSKWKSQALARIKRRSKNKPKKALRRKANAFVYHSKSGFEVIHMFMGASLTSVLPLKSGSTYYDDINDDFHIDAISTKFGSASGAQAAETYQLDCLGMITTGSPVAEDEVYNATICDTVGFFGNLDFIHRFIDGDKRGDEVSRRVIKLELLGSSNIVSQSTRGVTPLVVQTFASKGDGLYSVERFAVFMTDTGLVTCTDPSRRRVMWRAQTSSDFSSAIEQEEQGEVGMNRGLAVEKDLRRKPFPHLATYSLRQISIADDTDYVSGGNLRYRHTNPYILAVGEHSISAIATRSGKVVRSVGLDEPPVAPAIVGDFNGDGTNDLIIVTSKHIYGFLGSTQASSDAISSLMVLMIALLVLLFAAREVFRGEDDPAEASPVPFTGTSTASSEKPPAVAFKRATD